MGPQRLSSPDGRVTLDFEVNGEGEALYSLTFAGEEIIRPSALNIETSRGDFDEGLRVVDIKHSTFR